MNVITYRKAIDKMMKTIKPMMRHIEASSIAPNLALKLRHQANANAWEMIQIRAYNEILQHEREGFEIMTPYATKPCRFKYVSHIPLLEKESEFLRKQIAKIEGDE